MAKHVKKGPLVDFFIVKDITGFHMCENRCNFTRKKCT